MRRYSITSSASVSSVEGIVRPSVLAGLEIDHFCLGKLLQRGGVADVGGGFVEGQGCEAKYAATLAISWALSWITFIILLVAPRCLRVPSLNAFSCASIYAGRCAARLGIASLTLTPFAP